MVNACFVEINKLDYARHFNFLYAWFSFSKGVLGIFPKLDLFLLFNNTGKEDLVVGFIFHFLLKFTEDFFFIFEK